MLSRLVALPPQHHPTSASVNSKILPSDLHPRQRDVAKSAGRLLPRPARPTPFRHPDPESSLHPPAVHHARQGQRGMLRSQMPTVAGGQWAVDRRWVGGWWRVWAVGGTLNQQSPKNTNLLTATGWAAHCSRIAPAPFVIAVYALLPRPTDRVPTDRVYSVRRCLPTICTTGSRRTTPSDFIARPSSRCECEPAGADRVERASMRARE